MSLKERYLKAKRALFEKVYYNLNDRQREAVFTVNGPLLVLAGAGSGKTTVLVKRIAFILRYGNAYENETVPFGLTEEHLSELEAACSLSPEEIRPYLDEFAVGVCPPWRMLAITFTNKAANEIKSRLVAELADMDNVGEIWAGTFHSVCMRILRSHCEKLGYRPQFSIYDTDDTKRAILAAMKTAQVDEKLFPVKAVMNTIGRAKDKLLTPELFAETAGGDFRLQTISRIYQAYQEQLVASNAMDFDDIIMQTVFLLRDHADVRDLIQSRFRYVSVDEYQDTNEAQFRLTELLAGGCRNLMVVGDDDQSIYRFRGATVENILGFDHSYPDAAVIKLEQNYRSTGTILDAANAVISNNEGRKGKTLWTDSGKGDPIILRCLEDQNLEARFVVSTVERAIASGKNRYRDFAVLYRTNAQSNSMERAFAKSGVPYRMLGGVRFSDRKEIRDAVAYLQLICNVTDRERLIRIINEPKRKIGDKTLEAVDQIAKEQNCSMFEVMERAKEFVALSRSAQVLVDFTVMIRNLATRLEQLPLDVFFDEVLDRSGYRDMLLLAGEEEKERLENLEEFKSSIVEYQSSAENPTLFGFLEENALVADVDRYDESADAVVMMTIHSAKGLEFPIVFLPGMEDGLFPGMQTILASPADMEEERRLAYVAITRAKKQLYLLHTKNRLMYGRTAYNPISRFVEEIPKELLDCDAQEASESRYGYENSSYHSGMYGATFGGRKSYYSDSAYSEGSRSYGEMQSVDVKKTMMSSGKRLGGKPSFREGDRVRHGTFGEGEILSVKQMGADMLYEVIFDRVGTKRLMASYAKLTKVD